MQDGCPITIMRAARPSESLVSSSRLVGPIATVPWRWYTVLCPSRSTLHQKRKERNKTHISCYSIDLPGRQHQFVRGARAMKRGVMSVIALVLASAPHNCRSFGFRGDCAPGCTSSVDLGDGWCDDECNVEECEYDKGDCDVALRAIMSGTRCARDCRVAWIGDWTCDPACNVAACDFDGGDCMGNATWSCSSDVSGAEVPSGGATAVAAPAGDTGRALRSCARMWLGDGACDLECNSSACKHDNGDCLPGAAAEFCGSAGCRRSMVNDSVCNYECFSEACGWDGADCHMQCALGCHKHFLGDKRCNPECNVAVSLPLLVFLLLARFTNVRPHKTLHPFARHI